MEIVFVEDPQEKRRIAAGILGELPAWFGLPESTKAYIEASAVLPFWAAMEAGEPGKPWGFIVEKQTGPRTAELYVMGVRPQRHRQGTGRRLLAALEADCREKGFRFLQVKTVAAGHYEEYDRTRLFYEAMGFTQLEVFPTLWDPWNPCLVMVKWLGEEEKGRNEI